MERTLIVGDIHGCASEFNELLKLVNPTKLFLVGDLFTKGPEPYKVWELIQKYEAKSVLGNHDAWMLEIWEKSNEQPIKVLKQTDAKKWLESLPLIITEKHFTLVHAGLNPVGYVEKTTREQALVMRKINNVYWWEDVNWGTKPLVIYGHDAVQGVNDRRPQTLGLDSGCVYGGCLTGFLLEEDRLIEVPATKIYKAI